MSEPRMASSDDAGLESVPTITQCLGHNGLFDLALFPVPAMGKSKATANYNTIATFWS